MIKSILIFSILICTLNSLIYSEDVYVEEHQLIYPFIISARDLKELDTSPSGATYEIGHKLYVTLVYDMDGTARNLVQSDLDRLDISVARAHQYALDNLASLAETDKIVKRLIPGPNKQSAMVWGGHWLASSCLLLPNMNAWFKAELNSPNIFASIPERDVLMLFPNTTKNANEEVQKFIRYNHNKFNDPLSLRLFEITDEGVDPFY